MPTSPPATVQAVLASLLLAPPLAAQEPLGSIAAWHADLPGVAATAPGWTALDGQVHSEAGSPFDDLLLPDVNGAAGSSTRRFLRGAPLTGVIEDDALQGHGHASSPQATDFSTYGLCPGLIEETVSGPYFVYARLANLTIRKPSDDSVHGSPRLANETRPVNMSVRWILKTSDGELPIGAIVAWHRDLVGSPSTLLPAGWVPCDGQVVSDPSSPLDGTAVPELNASGRFLRGGTTSGALASDAMQDHKHGLSHDLMREEETNYTMFLRAVPGTTNPLAKGTIGVGDPVADALHGTPRVDTETRPVNMSVLWILKTRAGVSLPSGAIVGWHDEPAAHLPPLNAGPPEWYACAGQTVSASGSPYQGLALPELNASGRFLRGGTTSGILQDDAFQGHHHNMTHDALWHSSGYPPGEGDVNACGIFATGSLTVGAVTGARVASETRPDNMGVPWILYLPGWKGPRPQLAPTLELDEGPRTP